MSSKIYINQCCEDDLEELPGMTPGALTYIMDVIRSKDGKARIVDF
jgi:hypothetical protein